MSSTGQLEGECCADMHPLEVFFCGEFSKVNYNGCGEESFFCSPEDMVSVLHNTQAGRNIFSILASNISM
jgi:hypothetical protein